ncbi:MAG: thiamine-phosphate synthase family protein [Desulfurococcaceae archaeon]
MLIHELVSSRILPALRGIIAHKLDAMGVSQRKIAYYLEVTQPMVSKILRRPLSEFYVDLEKLGIQRDLVEHYVEILTEMVKGGDYDKFISTTFNVINQFALSAACNLRKNISTLCSSGFFRDPDIEYYKSALFRLMGIRGLERVIPEVGSNLVYAPRAPNNTGDIIGLTGRIVKTLSGVAFYGEPVYGGSKYVARILIIATKYNPKLRFCINIKYSPSIRVTIEKIGIPVADTGPHLREEDFWENVEKALTQKPIAICDHGGLGLEPIIYILAESSQQLESIIRAVVSGLQ